MGLCLRCRELLCSCLRALAIDCLSVSRPGPSLSSPESPNSGTRKFGVCFRTRLHIGRRSKLRGRGYARAIRDCQEADAPRIGKVEDLGVRLEATYYCEILQVRPQPVCAERVVQVVGDVRVHHFVLVHL